MGLQSGAPARPDVKMAITLEDYGHLWTTRDHVLVVGRNLAPNLCNSVPYSRFELLRKGAESSPCCRQPYQFRPAVGISQVRQIDGQFDSGDRN